MPVEPNITISHKYGFRKYHAVHTDPYQNRQRNEAVEAMVSLRKTSQFVCEKLSPKSF